MPNPEVAISAFGIRPSASQGDMTVMDPRWEAVVARDRRADGTFYYSVQDDRRLLPSVVRLAPAETRERRFHRTAADAERAGFRPCRRCKPDQPPIEQVQSARVAEICRLIESAPDTPSLASLSKRAGLSPYTSIACSSR